MDTPTVEIVLIIQTGCMVFIALFLGIIMFMLGSQKNW